MNTEKTEKEADISRPQVWGVERKCWLGIKIFVAVLAFGLLAYYLLPSKTVGQVKNNLEEQKKLSNIINRIINEEITVWVKNPIIINAVKKANEEATKSLNQIIELDERWKATIGVDEWIGSFMDNPCARYLKTLQNKKRNQRNLYAEIFVVDKQGCIVAMTNKTTDYWQGDEDKFIKSYANGRGAIFVNTAGYDNSSQVLSLIQVSGPVFAPDTGKAIGIITVGMDLDVLSEK